MFFKRLDLDDGCVTEERCHFCLNLAYTKYQLRWFGLHYQTGSRMILNPCPAITRRTSGPVSERNPGPMDASGILVRWMRAESWSGGYERNPGPANVRGVLDIASVTRMELELAFREIVLYDYSK